MADAPPPPPPPAPPVAIRITRPYDSEEEYLAQELEMISKTSITLVGAQPRPQGVVLRFELVLTGGAVLVRGEGRVVGFKPNAHRGVGGLTLRFTRIDARSKALLDKATAMREQRRPSSKPPKEATADAPPPPPPAPASPAPALPVATPPADVSPPPQAVAAAPPAPPPAAAAPDTPNPLPVVLSVPAAGPLMAASRPVAPAAPAAGPEVELVPAPPKPIEAPARTAAELGRPERDSLLERLRSRAKGLPPDVVRGILEKRS